MRIKVTEEDIKYAIRSDQCACAINLAIARQLPEAKFIQVNKSKIRYTIGDQRFVFNTPTYADKRIIKPWDQGETLKPCSFDLSPDKHLVEVRPAGNTPAKKKVNARNTARKRANQAKAAGRPFGSRNRYALSADTTV